MIRPLHNALLEDALDRAEAFLGKQLPQREWSLWVKVVRWMIRRQQSQHGGNLPTDIKTRGAGC
jgi:hypothetical protein